MLNMRHTKLSKRFKEGAVADRINVPNYRRAQLHGLNPITFSRMLHDAVPVAYMDPRIVSMGRDFGLEAEECFDDAPQALSGRVPVSTGLEACQG